MWDFTTGNFSFFSCFIWQSTSYLFFPRKDTSLLMNWYQSSKSNRQLRFTLQSELWLLFFKLEYFFQSPLLQGIIWLLFFKIKQHSLKWKGKEINKEESNLKLIFLMLEAMKILDKYLVKSHGNGSYQLLKLFLAMDFIGLKIIKSQNDKINLLPNVS